MNLVKNNKNTFDNWIFPITFLVLGITLTFYRGRQIFSEKIFNKLKVKRFDPSNEEIRIKSINNTYYFIYVIGFILIWFFYQELSDISAGIFLVLVLSMIFHLINFIYYKIKFNIGLNQDNKKGEMSDE